MLEDPNSRRPTSSWSIPERYSKKRFWAILIACICTLLFHLLFILLSHYGLIGRSSYISHSEKKPELIYEIALDNPKNMRFVDTNPYLNTEEPPETDNFAAKSQKAAQEVPEITRRKDIPTIEGDMEEILKIVPDNLVAQDELMELADSPVSMPSLSEVTMELKEQKELEGPKIGVRQKPKPRQRVKPLVGGLRTNTSAAKNIGITAVDARFNQFGEYMQKMHEAIGYQWYLLLSNYGPSMYELQGRVRISWTIDQAGSVIRLEVKEASSSNLLTLICKDSILSLSSFGPWSEDMMKILGKEQTFEVGFIVR